jgi:hypothetical protein
MLTVTIDCLPDCCRGRVYFLEEKQIWRSRVCMMRWAQMSETHDERGPLKWSVFAGAELAAAEPAICHHLGPDAAAPAIAQAGNAVSRIGMRTGKKRGFGPRPKALKRRTHNPCEVNG